MGVLRSLWMERLVLSFNKEIFVTVLHGDQRLETMCMEHALLCHTQHVLIC